ncbi:Metallo-dependent phosphatase, partial [Neocallimastix sp. 'constans']
MNKQWVLDITIATYAISILLYFIFHNGINYKSRNNLGNYQNIITINDKKDTKKNYNSDIIDNKPSNIFYFVQISDIHISEVFTEGSFSHLKCFVENVLPLISPRFVFVTGDITDAAPNNGLQSVQKETEWQAYKKLLDNNEFIQKHDNKTFWFDMRGNHDSFNTPSFDHEANLYKKYSRSQTQSFHINYMTNYGSYTFNSIDATPLHGPSSPYNLFGVINREKIDKLASVYDFAKANKHKHIFTFSHYPQATINFAKTSDARSWNELSKQTSLFFSGHLHDLYLGEALYTHHKNFIELEIKDLKLQGTYRIIAVDHDTINFVDNILPMPEIPYLNKDSLDELLEQHYNFTIEKPIVLITNPQDIQMALPENHFPKLEEKTLTHVRSLIFSEKKINSIELFIDGKKISTIDSLSNENSSFKLVGNDDKNADDYLPLYAMKWDGNEYYDDGKVHTMIVKAYDQDNNVGENTVRFSFDYKREDFRISIIGRKALTFYLPILLPLGCAGLIFMYHFVLAVIPFLYYYNNDENNVNYKEIDQFEMENLNESDSESSDDGHSYHTSKFNKSKQKGLIFRLFIQPFINFASNPYLFYPYHFFYLYNLIGPQIFGNLMSAGDHFGESFVMAFLHGVVAGGQRINFTDGYFYMLKDLIKIQPILFLLMVYLNHCKCRQYFITIIFHILLIFYCLHSRNKIITSYGMFKFFSSPFYSWFIIWEVISIIMLIIKNYKKYPSNYGKIFK